MSDPKKELQKMFSSREKYSNFGPALSSVTIHGFRGIENLTIDIESPITAITGLNGTGKSTIAQLCICGYKKPKTESKKYSRQYIAKYFPASKADPNPFLDDASVNYSYLTNAHDTVQEVKVYRSNSQWEGYKRQPERHCRYIGFSFYIPKVERIDISIYGRDSVEISNENSLNDYAIQAISKILNHPYSLLTSATVKHKKIVTDIGFASKFGKKYSENNMGFGEGRLFYIVNSLETAPEQSLFILEEPETSLHEHAQYEFAKYLIDVVIRRKHQIVLTTHSKTIINALPRDSRKMLYYEGSNLRISNQTSTAEATGLLSLGRSADKIILVEDLKAKALLTEVIRKAKPTLLNGVRISFVGNDDVVSNLTKRFTSDGYNTVGVRDGDKGEDLRNKIYKLPGSLPPEKEVFCSDNVVSLISSHYNINLSDWVSLNEDKDFHEWPGLLAEEVRKSEDGLWEEMAKAYCDGVNFNELEKLVTAIEL